MKLSVQVQSRAVVSKAPRRPSNFWGDLERAPVEGRQRMLARRRVAVELLGAGSQQVGSPSWARAQNDRPAPELGSVILRLSEEIGRAYGVELEVVDRSASGQGGLRREALYGVLIDGRPAGGIDTCSHRFEGANPSPREIACRLVRRVERYFDV